MQGGGEGIGMGEGRLTGMKQGKGAQVSKVGVCGASGPGPEGHGKGVRGGWAGSCISEGIPQ